jgi:hypothetical protein
MPSAEEDPGKTPEKRILCKRRGRLAVFPSPLMSPVMFDRRFANLLQKISALGPIFEREDPGPALAGRLKKEGYPIQSLSFRHQREKTVSV